MVESEGGGMSTMLKAREKNMLEELKLQREMTALEVERRHNEKVMYNEVFEQRRVAYQLKKEVAELKKKSDEERNRRKTSKLLLRARMNSTLSDSFVPRTPLSAGVPTSSRKGSIDPGKMFPTITPVSAGSPATAVPRPSLWRRVSQSMPTLPSIQDEETRPEPTIMEQPIPEDPLPPTSSGQAPPTTAPANPAPSDAIKSRFASLVRKAVKAPSEDSESGCVFFPKTKKASWAAILDRLVPKRITRKPLLEKEHHDSSLESGESSEIPDIGDVVVLTDFWVGDPKAINSVRRPRRSADAMTNREKSIGEVRKLIRDMPTYPSCSRNCNRPGAALESIASSMPVYNLPALAKSTINRKASSAQLLLNMEADDDAGNLPPIPVASPSANERMIEQTLERRKNLIRMTKKLSEDFRRATSRRIFQKSSNVDSSGRVQITLTYGGTRLRKNSLKTS